jgi:hypothetical protein
MTTDQIIKSRARLNKGDSVYFEGQTWKIGSIGYYPQDDELFYLLERHDHSQPKTVLAKELEDLYF